jgi:DNA-binding NarL/FixJ family response regulator
VVTTTALASVSIIRCKDVNSKTRQERERLVLDLYNQGKTIREIAKEARISFRDMSYFEQDN